MKMKRFLITLLALVFLTVPGVAWGANYYVTDDAGGTGVGSEGDPWTMTQLNAANLANSDTVYLNNADTFTTTLTLDGTAVGRSGITINGDTWGGGTKVWINANSVRPIAIDHALVNLTLKGINCSGMDSNTTARVYIKGVNGIVLDSIDINGHTGSTTYNAASAVGKFSHGIGIYGGTIGDITIQNCTIQNLMKDSYANTVTNWGSTDVHALILYFSTPSQYRSGTITVTNNFIHDVWGDCIQTLAILDAAVINIYGNQFYNFGENAVDIKSAQNHNVYNNVMYRGDYGLGGTGGGLATVVEHRGTPDYVCQNNKIYNNYFGKNGYCGIRLINSVNGRVYGNKFIDNAVAIRFSYTSNTWAWNNVIDNSVVQEVATGWAYASIWVDTNAKSGTLILNNTIYEHGPEALYGILNQYTGTTAKNNVLYLDRNSASAYPLSSSAVITADYNAYYNPNNANTITGGTDAHAVTTDPGLSNLGTSQLWALNAASAIINAGVDVSGNIDATSSGLDSASVWEDDAWSLLLVPRMDNGGYDIGAYEYKSEVPPPPPSGAGDCPTGTYAAAWSGDHSSGTGYICTDSGEGDPINASTNGSPDIGAYPFQGTYGLRIPVTNDSRLMWTGIDIDTSEGTIWMRLYPESTTGDTEIFCIYIDSQNLIRSYFNGGNKTGLWHEGNDISAIVVSSNTINDAEFNLVGFAWSVASNQTAVYVGGEWKNDTDTDTVTALVGSLGTFDLGDRVLGITDPYRVDNFSIHKTYKADPPTWDAVDVTSPTITARGVCSDASCTACTTDLDDAWGAETVRVCAALSEDVIVTVSPTWQMDAGPTTEKVTGAYFEKIDISGTKYLTAQFTFTSRMRFSDPQLYEMTGGTIQDGSGNDLDTTGSAGDISSGTLTIGVAGDFTVGTFSGTDEDGNAITWDGEYSTMTALKAAFSILDGDNFSIGTVTESGALDLSGDDCTEANPCRATLSGAWTQAGAGLTTGDWWEFYCEGNSIVGPVAFGANNTFNRCKLNE